MYIHSIKVYYYYFKLNKTLTLPARPMRACEIFNSTKTKFKLRLRVHNILYCVYKMRRDKSAWTASFPSQVDRGAGSDVRLFHLLGPTQHAGASSSRPDRRPERRARPARSLFVWPTGSAMARYGQWNPSQHVAVWNGAVHRMSTRAVCAAFRRRRSCKNSVCVLLIVWREAVIIFVDLDKTRCIFFCADEVKGQRKIRETGQERQIRRFLIKCIPLIKIC